MPRSASPEWRRRKEPILDAHLFTSVNQANGQPDPETGHYATLLYTGCGTKARAEEIKRALHRCATYHGYSMSAKIIRRANGTFDVEYRAISKSHARAYILKTYGPDRTKWPYDPRRRNPKASQ